MRDFTEISNDPREKNLVDSDMKVVIIGTTFPAK
jgi:hypothetical protein